jgi:tRNA (guanine10-N2)-dimethyltransferase
MILGRQPAIGLAELESLYGAENIRPVGSHAAMVDVEIDFARIGGSSKAAKVLNILDTTDWREIQSYLEYNIPQHLEHLGEGKLSLGLSAYGFQVNAKKVMATGLNLKKVIRLTGRPVRLVPNVEPALNSAQVLHNKLTSPLGWELLLIRDDNKTILAQTTHEQDIEGYSLRDHGRPMRDARIGMLPPKLAQIIVNLAQPDQSRSFSLMQGTKSEVQPGTLVDPARNGTLEQANRKGDRKIKVLDPFCGTGVVLQEAGLMRYGIYGTDIDERMVDYTRQNLHWLATKTNYDGHDSRFETADATIYHWPHEYDVIATETYLGRAFTSPPPLEMLEKNRRDCDTIIRKFLRNVYNQTKPGFRMALALPAWALPHSSSHILVANFLHLPLLDSLGELGYNQLEFEHATKKDMIYHRDGQIVGRELVVLIRK